MALIPLLNLLCHDTSLSILLVLSLSSFPLRAALLPQDDGKTPDRSLGSPAETHSGDLNLSDQEPRRPLDPGTEEQLWKALEKGDTVKVQEIVRHFSFDVNQQDE